jgi:hypothetical protein
MIIPTFNNNKKTKRASSSDRAKNPFNNKNSLLKSRYYSYYRFGLDCGLWKKSKVH